MTPEELDDALRVWGRVFGQSKPHEWAEDSSPTGNSSLAAFGDYARKKKVKHDVAGRDGRSRSYTLGAAAGLMTASGRVIPAPMWAFSPIPCTETRARQSSPPRDPRLTPIVDKIQAAWLTLVGCEPSQAEVLRVQYQVRELTRTEKAKMVGKTPRQYKYLLACGRVWINERIGSR